MAQTKSQDSNYERMQKSSTDKEISLLTIIQENSQFQKKNNNDISSYGVSVK